MAFTARLLKAVKIDIGWKLQIEFTDGTDVQIKEYRYGGTTTQELVSFVRSEANRKTDIKGSVDFGALVGQAIDLTLPTPDPDPEPPVPTTEEIAHRAWMADWRKLQEIQRLFAAIPNLATTQGLQYEANLKATLEADWLNSYLGKGV